MESWKRATSEKILGTKPGQQAAGARLVLLQEELQQLLVAQAALEAELADEKQSDDDHGGALSEGHVT